MGRTDMIQIKKSEPMDDSERLRVRPQSGRRCTYDLLDGVNGAGLTKSSVRQVSKLGASKMAIRQYPLEAVN